MEVLLVCDFKIYGLNSKRTKTLARPCFNFKRFINPFPVATPYNYWEKKPN